MECVNWAQEAIKMKEEGIPIRQIARTLGRPYTTVWDELDRKEMVKKYMEKTHDSFVKSLSIETPSGVLAGSVKKSSVFKIDTNPFAEGPTIVFLPDAQVKPGVDLTYLHCQGEYIAQKKPDVVVCAGDFADMESLSTYDKGKKSAEGKRVAKDIEAAIKGMEALLTPVKLAQMCNPEWKPRLVMLEGNHESRLSRHVEANPELHGFLSCENLRYKDFGWEVYDFLKPVVIGGVTFIHYFPNPMTGKPLGGNALSILKTVGGSLVQGHRQTLDVATRTLHTGVQQWSIVAGASYDFDESYKGFTGNKHWRGIVVMHNVKNGGFDPLFVSTEYLKDKYRNVGQSCR